MPVTIASPEAAVAATPYVLGFAPRDSVVLLLSGDGPHLALRVDLPERAELTWIATILAGLPNPLPSKAVVLAYADAREVSYTAEIAKWLADLLVAVTDLVSVLVIGDGRVRSLSDDGLLGQELDIDLESLRDHPVIAECVAEGMTCSAARETLANTLLRVVDPLSRQVADALRSGTPPSHGYETERAELEQRALQVLLAEDPLAAEDVVCVSRACRDVHVRDPLLAIILDEHAHAQVSLAHVRTRLLYALTHLPDSDAAPVAATMALIAWADGDGAVALMAADRACDLEPTNTLAPLVIHALQHGLPPNTWASLTDDIPMEVLRGQVRRTA
jgi:hypothetical protein